MTEKNQKKKLFFNTWRWYEIQIVSTSFVEHSPYYIIYYILSIYILSKAAFAQWEPWVVATETLGPTKPKRFTIYPFTEKVLQTPEPRA